MIACEKHLGGTLGIIGAFTHAILHPQLSMFGSRMRGVQKCEIGLDTNSMTSPYQMKDKVTLPSPSEPLVSHPSGRFVSGANVLHSAVRG